MNWPLNDNLVLLPNQEYVTSDWAASFLEQREFIKVQISCMLSEMIGVCSDMASAAGLVVPIDLNYRQPWTWRHSILHRRSSAGSLGWHSKDDHVNTVVLFRNQQKNNPRWIYYDTRQAFVTYL